MVESQSTTGYMAMNSPYLSSTALELRLQTDSILDKIQSFLSGKKSIMVMDETTGRGKLQVEHSKPLMNGEGVHHLVNYVSSIINPAVVQGNYTDEWWRECIAQTHENLAYILVVNTQHWQVDPTSRVSIISFIMELVKPFLSRLVDNEERKSYTQTIKATESNTVSQYQPGVLNKVGIR